MTRSSSRELPLRRARSLSAKDSSNPARSSRFSFWASPFHSIQDVPFSLSCWASPILQMSLFQLSPTGFPFRASNQSNPNHPVPFSGSLADKLTKTFPEPDGCLTHQEFKSSRLTLALGHPLFAGVPSYSTRFVPRICTKTVPKRSDNGSEAGTNPRPCLGGGFLDAPFESNNQNLEMTSVGVPCGVG